VVVLGQNAAFRNIGEGGEPVPPAQQVDEGKGGASTTRSVVDQQQQAPSQDDQV